VGAGADVCVSGTISQSDEYGPTLALNLNQADTALDPLGYVPADHGIVGFTWGITGSAPPSTLQVTFLGMDGSNYCEFMTPGTSNALSIAQAQLDCWNGSGTAATTSTSFQAVQFQLPVNYHADGQAFSFCITNLKAL
jgi:hypothetical protein